MAAYPHRPLNGPGTDDAEPCMHPLEGQPGRRRRRRRRRLGRSAAIAEALEVGLSTVARVRRRYVSEGLEAALTRKAPEREYRRKLDGSQEEEEEEEEARLVALACGEPPTGRKRWTLRMLADRLVALEVEEGEEEDGVSHETVRQTLKQTNYSCPA